MKATGQPRADVLTVTYFIDARRKRHVEISIGRLRLLLATSGALAAIGLWTVLSALSGHAARPRPNIAQVALSPLTPVGGSAAPKTPSAPVRQTPEATGEPLTIQSASVIAAPHKIATRVEVVTAPTFLAPSEPRAAAPSSWPLASETPAASTPVAITEISIQHVPVGLTARFAIANLAPDASEGRVTGFATFVAATGASIQVPAEQEQTFRARHRTLKELRFVAPASAGRFSGLKILVFGTPGLSPKVESLRLD